MLPAVLGRMACHPFPVFLSPLPLSQMLIPVLIGFPSYPMQSLCHAGEATWMFFRAEAAEGAVERMDAVAWLSSACEQSSREVSLAEQE